MGCCNNCKKEIHLDKNDTEKKCPGCGENPYICWKCGTELELKELEECPLCHYFICKCGGIIGGVMGTLTCGPSCKMNQIVGDSLASDPLLFLRGSGLDPIKVAKMVRYLVSTGANEVSNPPEKRCYRGIGISYREKLTHARLKMLPGNARSNEETRLYKSRLDNIIKYPIGYKWIIDSKKNDGEYGVEFRDASNMAVCFGYCKKEFITPEGISKRQYAQYTREDGEKCEYVENLQEQVCNKCYKPECDCVYKKKSKVGNLIYQAGERFPKHSRRKQVQSKSGKNSSAVLFCQMGRDKFEEVKKETPEVSRVVSPEEQLMNAMEVDSDGR